MSWLGTWRNRYGSTVTITSDGDGRVGGSFRTAIESSPYYGLDVPLTGVHSGSVISFGSGLGDDGNSVVSCTGKLRDGVVETLCSWSLGSSIGGKRSPPTTTPLNGSTKRLMRHNVSGSTSSGARTKSRRWRPVPLEAYIFTLVTSPR
jgi:Avidin family